ncbi:MAG: arginine--tRNA ligase [Chloroherpetonaceae bacterium]|nr:arginine--tRNA ligase [Chloroherpetonaceae bacterium]
MRDFFSAVIRKGIERIGASPDTVFQVEKPADEKFGDVSTNAAMVLAKNLKKNPRQVAEELIKAFDFPSGSIQKMEVAGAGFINFTLDPQFIRASLKSILLEKENYGKGTSGVGKRVIVEYLSANPTGPLSIGRGRGGVLGDTIANLFAAQGYSVTREYYFNNAGRQMRILGDSVRLRYRELCGIKEDYPAEYYQGEYIRDIAEKIYEEHGNALMNSEDTAYFKDIAEGEIFEGIKATLKRLNIRHDSFFNENTLYQVDSSLGESRNEVVIRLLRQKGFIYEKDGAVWFKTSELGKTMVDKETKETKAVDTVLIKSNGEPSYRLPDIAYHTDKFDRKFDLMVNVFGADHIDEYPDVLRALKVLGYDESRVKVAINQFVTTMQEGKAVKISTRRGNADTLDALIDMVGADATRFFFIMRSKDSHLNFDLDLALKQSADNPVFYLQYAHARICGILRTAEEKSGVKETEIKGEYLTALAAKEEMTLAKTLMRFPDAVLGALDGLEPQRLIGYLDKVAEDFHKFYQECRIVGEENEIMQARLSLALAAKQVLKNGLYMLGISAPEKM